MSIGRTGKATPFAVLEPVFVGGSTVSLATLHNEDQVRAKDVRPGRHRRRAQGRRRDPRGGGAGAREGRRRKPEVEVPDDVPELRRARWSASPGESDTFCTNLDCPGQRVQRIAHFASRSAMDIEGLGEQRVQLFVDHGLLADVADLYSFTADTFEGLEGFAALSIANLLAAIDASRDPAAAPGADRTGHPPPRPGRLDRPGPGAAGTSTGSWPPTRPPWPPVDGVGPVIAASVVPWFASAVNRSVVERLRAAGVNLSEPGAGDRRCRPRPGTRPSRAGRWW